MQTTSRIPTPQPDPWKDFFDVYLDLGHALQAEIARDPQMTDTAQQLGEFLHSIRAENDPRSGKCRDIVHEVIKRFRNKSKQILYQEPSYFDNELLLFPSIALDVATLWRERPLYRNGLWQWIEQLYIIGNVCLHPNRKDQFLQAVRQLKQAKNGVPPIAVEGADDGTAPVEEENMDAVVDQMAQMFGMGENPAMKGFMAKMARSLHGKMANAENPMGMLQAVISGDLSALGDLQQEMEKDITAAVESGEVSEADFAKSREGMIQRFGGMDGLMQMAQGMGLQVPGNDPDVAAQYQIQASQAPQAPQASQASQAPRAPAKQQSQRAKQAPKQAAAAVKGNKKPSQAPQKKK